MVDISLFQTMTLLENNVLENIPLKLISMKLSMAK